MKKQINVFDYAKEIMEAVQTGVLLIVWQFPGEP